jgi:hypothetical protein
MARRLLIVFATTMAFVAGCGGGSGSGNGEQAKTAGQILADARTAATGAGSVHVTGTILDSGTKLKLDLRAGDHTGSGTITFRGSPVRVVRIGKTLYIQAPESFYRATGADSATARLLAGKWLKASATQKDFAQLAQLTRLKDLLTLTTKPDGKVSKGGTSTVAGTSVIALKDDKGGSLYIATTGKPYPVALRGKNSTSSGDVHFSEWGEPVEASAPKGAIDLGALGG